jgi:hypothetical protein
MSNSDDSADDLLVDLDVCPSPENKCKGLFFKYVVNDYENDRSIVKKQTMRFLKRKSCNRGDCSLCDWVWEDISMDGVDHFHFPKNGKNNGIYKLKFVEDHRDWDTGYIEDWHYEFCEVTND